MRWVPGWRAVFFLVAGMLGAPGTAPAEGDPDAGEQKAAVCAGCHGPEGVSLSPEVPNLAGQKETYMINALQAYQSGLRNNPLMKSMVQGLSEQDIEDLAAYYSRL